MNIFVLDLDPQTCAQYHCDKHVVKMTLETAQILSTVLGGPYRPTHQNHPCVKWVRESTGNLLWLWSLGCALGEEYWVRYGKEHKSYLVIANLQLKSSACEIDGPKTPFALAMPDQYKGSCPVQSYRDYYRGEKASIATYTKRQRPYWL